MFGKTEYNFHLFSNLGYFLVLELFLVAPRY